MNKAYLSLGTNMGDKANNLVRAVDFINQKMGFVAHLSSVYETDPWEFESNSSFYNMVIEVESELSSHQMITRCLEIETLLGRVRNQTEGYSSRIIDIDILFYNDEVILDNDLTLPHPHLSKRRFVLEPLNEIAGGYLHPVLHCSVSELLTLCPDQSKVALIGSLKR